MVAREAPSAVQAEVASEYVARSGETRKQDDPDAVKLLLEHE